MYPVPCPVILNEGDLRHGLGAAGFRPHVVEESLPLLLSHLRHLTEDIPFAFRILLVREVFAFHLRLGGVHDHSRVRVNDEEILVVAVTQAPDVRDGPLLCLVDLQFPRLGLSFVIVHECVSCVYKVLGGHLLLVHEPVLQQGQEVGEHADHDHHDGEQRDAHDLRRDRPILKPFHTASSFRRLLHVSLVNPPKSFLSSIYGNCLDAVYVENPRKRPL